MLAEVLSATGIMGYPEEYFNSDGDADTPVSLSLILKNELSETEGILCNNVSDYINSIRREYSTSNGVFGYEATFFQLQQVLERSSLFSLLGDNLLFISLTREDFISQAISLYKTTKTGFFHSIKHKIEDFIQKDQNIEYNREEIKQWVMHILQQEYGNEKLFTSMGVEPLRLTYEKLVADTLGCIKEIATYIGVTLPDSFSISKTRNEKVGTSLNEQFKERFMAEEEKFVQLCYELRGTVPAHLIEKFAQLFIDTGEGFEERHSIIKTVTGEESQLAFNLSGYDFIKQLRFDPLNTLVIVRISRIVLIDQHQVSHELESHEDKALVWQADKTLVFDTDDSQIYLDLQNDSSPQRIVFP